MHRPREKSVLYYEVSNALRKIPRQDMARPRQDNIDVARGTAIALMFLSHTTMALNTWLSLPDYAIMPIHTLTKWSSTLFILVFGVSMAQFYLPKYGTAEWPRARWRLLWRALVILLWYKILTLVQMFYTLPRENVINALLFREFPDYVEVLGFYCFALVWLTLLIPLWARWHWVFRLGLVAALAGGGTWLHYHYDFGGHWQLKAILVEQEGEFCFGQFQRGALAVFGMILGGLLGRNKDDYEERRWVVGAICVVIGTAAAAAFLSLTGDDWATMREVLIAIAKNFGKHPPLPQFSTFSLAGSSLILGLCLMMGPRLTRLLTPLRLIGQESFFCFNYHILVIFLLYRYALDLRLKVSYGQTWLLFLAIFISAALLAPLNTKLKKSGVLWKWLLP